MEYDTHYQGSTLTHLNVCGPKIDLHTINSSDECVCTMDVAPYSLSKSTDLMTFLKECHVHILGSLISVVFQTSETSQKCVILRIFPNMSTCTELLHWNNIFSSKKSDTKKTTVFQIASTHLCSLGSYNFNNFAILFVTSLQSEIFLYNCCIQFHDSWEYEPNTPASLQFEHLILLLKNETVHTLYEKSLDVPYVVPLLSAVKLCHRSTKYFEADLSQTILVCYITGTGHIRCLIISLHLDVNHRCLKPTIVCISSCFFFLDTLGPVTKITVGSSVFSPETQNAECLILLSGLKRCAILKATYLFSSSQIFIKVFCIGKQEAIKNTITDVEPFYTGVNPFHIDADTLTYTLCTRSNNRLWLADLQGNVESTLKIKSSSFGHIAYCHNNYLLTWNCHMTTKFEGISIHLLCLTQLRVIQKFTLYSKFHASSMCIVATSWDRHAKQAAFIVQELSENDKNSSTSYPFLTVYILTFKFHSVSPNITQLAFASLQPSHKVFFGTRQSLPSHPLQLSFQNPPSHEVFMHQKRKHKTMYLTTSKFSIISTLQTQPLTIAWYTWCATRKRIVFVWHTTRTWWKKDRLNFFVSSFCENVSQRETRDVKCFPAVSASLKNVSQKKSCNVKCFRVTPSSLVKVSKYENKKKNCVLTVTTWLNDVIQKITTQRLFREKRENLKSTFLFKSIRINHHYPLLRDALQNNVTFLSHSSFPKTASSTCYLYSLFVYFTNQIPNRQWMALTDPINFPSALFYPITNNTINKMSQEDKRLCFYPTGFLLVWQENPVMPGCSHSRHVFPSNRVAEQDTVPAPFRLLITLPYHTKIHLSSTRESPINYSNNNSTLLFENSQTDGMTESNLTVLTLS